ncbi:hypothetical protein F8M41_017149 [Gigaspora margarita]|uniref:Transmembrane protein n=1 Tax=Gigaspora margarita TaxID=4874 RepID=A0A8H4EMB0_GIGMA|nr:hypothetical protein F8M41_017149 [Gigaspora margarita]
MQPYKIFTFAFLLILLIAYSTFVLSNHEFNGSELKGNKSEEYKLEEDKLEERIGNVALNLFVLFRLLILFILLTCILHFSVCLLLESSPPVPVL